MMDLQMDGRMEKGVSGQREGPLSGGEKVGGQEG